jgi:hypothetical protein
MNNPTIGRAKDHHAPEVVAFPAGLGFWQPRAVSVVGEREARTETRRAMTPEVDAFLAEVRATLDHPSLLM